MLFEWDEKKNAANLEKHGIGFSEADEFDWDNAYITDQTRKEEGEKRLVAVSFMGGKLYTIIFTMRGKAVRCISLRRSNKREERDYANR